MTKSHSAGFDICLKYGECREQAFARLILSARVEIKSDKKQQDTGYLFIEYRQCGRPSGIAVTQAEFWAFEYLPERWLIIPTNELKAIATRIYAAKGNRKKGGDNNNEGVLVPIAALLER